MLIAMEPDTSSNQRPVIQASEILAKIERGEAVKYDGVIIEGDLDISGLELPTEHVDRTEAEEAFGLLDELKMIRSPINITISEIRGKVDFSNARFQEPISLEAVFISGYASFGGAEFRGNASFRGAKFSGDADFTGTEFTGGDADFSSARFTSGANILGARFSGETRIRWKYILHRDAYDYKLYSKLRENYESLGWFMDADSCYYETRKKLREDLKWYYKPIDWILMAIYGYGVKPERTLLCSLVLILVFGLFFWCFSGIIPSHVADHENSIDSNNESTGISLIGSLSFSSAVFLSGTQLFVDPPDYTNKTGVPLNSNSFTRSEWAFTIERVMGGLLFLMFLGTVGRTIITR